MCVALYALGNACIGASPVAYASDIMPPRLGGFGLGMYRCAGDVGKLLTCLGLDCLLKASVWCIVQHRLWQS